MESVSRIYYFADRAVSFELVTAVWHQEPEAGRRDAVLVHDLKDTYGDCDGVVFEVSLPDTEKDAEIFLQNETLETDFRTLRTVDYVEADENLEVLII